MSSVVKFSNIVYNDSDLAVKNLGGDDRNSQIIKSFDAVKHNRPLIRIPDATSVYKRENLKEELIEQQNNLSLLEKQRTMIKRNSEILDELRANTDKTNWEARSIILEAQKQAEEILSEARDKALRIVSESAAKVKLAEERASFLGEAKGFVKGTEEGIAKKTEEIDKRLEEIENVICEIKSKKDEVIQKFENGMVDVIIKIASKIIDDELKTQPYTIIKMLRKVIEENKNEAWIKVTIADGLNSITAAANLEVVEELKKLGDNISIEIVESEQKDKCTIETPRGYIDLSYNLQLKNMENAMRKS